MKPRRCATPVALLAVITLATGVHAATTIDRDVNFPADRLTLTPRATFTEVSMPGAVHEFRAGRPDVPWVAERVEVPVGFRVSALQVLAVDTTPWHDGITLPSAPVFKPGLGPVERTPADPRYFASPAAQPEHPAEIGIQGFEDGHNLAVVNVSPVRWQPMTRTLERVTHIRFRLTLVPTQDRPLARERNVDWAPPMPARANADLEAAGIRDGVRAHPFAATQIPSVEGSPVEYVIITNDEMAPQFQRLADWKTASGVPAVVRTISFIQQQYPGGSDDAERLRLFLRDAYQRWGTKYALLGGDTDVLPTRFAYTQFYGNAYIPTDLYYSCLDGNWNADGDSIYGEGWTSDDSPGDSCDLLPELYVGRAPTTTLAQAQQFVDKTLQYEQTPVGDYENRLLFFAEVLFPQDWTSGPTSFDGAEVVEDALPVLNANPNLRYARLYQNYTDSRWQPGALQERRDWVRDSLSRGYGISVHVGHGYRNVMSCGDDNLTNADATSLTNGNRLTNLYAIDCTSNAIDFPCIGEAFLLCPTGGAVTNIGSTTLDFPYAGRAYEYEYFRLVFQDSVSTIGQAQAEQKSPFVGSAYFDGVQRWTQMTLLLLGDPELHIWTGLPRTLTVTKPSSMSASDTTIAVHVTIGATPLYGARVTAWKAGADYQTATTDGAGNATLLFRPDQAGSLSLTVTAYDCKPYQGTITITAGSAPVLASAVPLIIDDGSSGTTGNGDGSLDAGETVNLKVAVTNHGGSMAGGVTGTLATTDGVVSVLVPHVTFGAIAPNGTVNPSVDFKVFVPYSAGDQREIPFTLTLLDNAGRHTERRFQLVTHAPEVHHYRHLLVDTPGNGNNRPDPGETLNYFVRLKNTGTGTAQDLVAVLRNHDGLGTVSDSSASWPDLGPGEEGDGDALVATASSTAATFELLVYDRYGLILDQTLDLQYPPSPTLLVATGNATSVTLQWEKSPATDLLGYYVYRASSVGGPYARVNPVPTDRTAYYLDEGLSPLTRYYYKVSSVDQSGNESALSAVGSASTNPPRHAIFPIPMGQETPSSVAVDHLYPGYPMDIVAGSDVLYVWHPNGDAPRDADGGGASSGDFTRRGHYYAAGPSIGDLDHNGTPEIVGASWDSLRVYTFDLNGNVRPGWPVVTSDPVWSSVALGDLDGDSKMELVWGSNGNNIYAVHQNGAELINGDSNPATQGVFKVLGTPYNFGTPAIVDLDNNGQKDIVYGGADGWLYAWRANGSNLPGFPVYLGGAITSSVAVGYLDGPSDNQYDIVAASNDDSLFVVRADGSRRPGFPINITFSGNSKVPSPALADMDHDGYLDIVVASTYGAIFVVKRNGQFIPQWAGVLYSTHGFGASESSPVVADIDGDGWADVVMGDESGYLNALSGANASVLAGFPIKLGGEVRGTPALCDCDGDGMTEIVLADWDKNLYVWDYDFPFSPGVPPPWPQFHHDARRTGLYDSPLFVGVDDGPSADAPPAQLAFAAPQPNPARRGTHFELGIPSSGAGQDLDVSVFDLSGRRVQTLHHGAARPGRLAVDWNLRGGDGALVRDGVYFVRVALGAQGASQKLVVIH